MQNEVICRCMSACVYTQSHISNVYVDMHTCLRMCMHMYIYAYIYVCLYVYTCLYLQTCRTTASVPCSQSDQRALGTGLSWRKSGNQASTHATHGGRRRSRGTLCWLCCSVFRLICFERLPPFRKTKRGKKQTQMKPPKRKNGQGGIQVAFGGPFRDDLLSPTARMLATAKRTWILHKNSSRAYNKVPKQNPTSTLNGSTIFP